VDLKRKGNVPGIAGCTASYLMRQLRDIKQGTRKSQAMTLSVAKLDIEHMISLVA
jgi:cytochrome c553